MKPTTAIAVILPLVVTVTAFVLVSTRGAGAGASENGIWWDEPMARFVREKVANAYVDPLDDARASEAFYKALDAYVHDLDEYCDFIPPDEHKKWLEDTAGEYAGLGVKVQDVPEGLWIVGVLPQGPAANAGIHPGDTIVAAAGHRLANLDLDTIEATRLLKGEAGSRVNLGVISGPRPKDGPATGPEREVVVQRAVVRPPSVFTRRVGPDGLYGVVRLTEFVEATEEDFDAAVRQLLAQEVKGLILDLRDNGGGVLATAVAVVDRFVRSGTIVRMEGRAPNATRVYEARADNTLPDTIPLIVLVNSGSASASEVVAGALQDHRRALLVGERTYGKFLVQQVLDVPGRDAAVQLTTSRYYLPSGRSYQRPRRAPGARGPAASQPGPNGSETVGGWGLLPDVIVPLDKAARTKLAQRFANEEAVPWQEETPFPEVPTTEMDAQLERAIDLLQGELVLQKIRASR